MNNMIGNLTTVNCGKIVNISEIGLKVEVMGPGYTTHQTNMIAIYATEGNVKVEIVFDGTDFYIYRFRRHTDLQHYWSRKHTADWMLSHTKYAAVAKGAIKAYNIIFNSSK